tara:strand:- start:4665 stop:4880 length:216 start_codon:yes stop_codon:yes gene_type:complete
MAANNDTLKEGVQILYQVTRQSGVAADVHDRCLKAAQELVAHLDGDPGSNSDQPEIVMPGARGKSKEPVKT